MLKAVANLQHLPLVLISINVFLTVEIILHAESGGSVRAEPVSQSVDRWDETSGLEAKDGYVTHCGYYIDIK